MKNVEQQLVGEWDCSHPYCLCLIYLLHFLPCYHSVFTSLSFPECESTINSFGTFLTVSRFSVDELFPRLLSFGAELTSCGIQSFYSCSFTAGKSEFTCTSEIVILLQWEKLTFIIIGKIATGCTFLTMASSVLIVHSMPLFTNWSVLWTARCDQPWMWLYILAFAVPVINLSLCISLLSGFSPASFVCAHVCPSPYPPTKWSLIPTYTCAFWLPSLAHKGKYPPQQQIWQLHVFLRVEPFKVFHHLCIYKWYKWKSVLCLLFKPVTYKYQFKDKMYCINTFLVVQPSLVVEFKEIDWSSMAHETMCDHQSSLGQPLALSTDRVLEGIWKQEGLCTGHSYCHSVCIWVITPVCTCITACLII